jgi:hydroxyacylglutathione hydrolase
MVQEITTISLKISIASVNCYLIKLDSGFILIDTGFTSSRKVLEQKLNGAGCKPGNLKLIVITHGDFDHIGNCLYLRDKFKSKIAMHSGDSGMAERGDMFWNRKKPNFFMKTLANLLFKLKESDRFLPDICLNDGDDLIGYGLNAKVLSIPGHSRGSVGVLIECGDLFCGDLFENIHKPVLNSIMDDLTEARSSIRKLDTLKIGKVYPGHGNTFVMEELKRSNCPS